VLFANVVWTPAAVRLMRCCIGEEAIDVVQQSWAAKPLKASGSVLSHGLFGVLGLGKGHQKEKKRKDYTFWR